MSRIYGRCCALFVFRVLTRFALYIGEIARTLEEVSPRATSANLRLAPLRWREKRSKRKKQPSLTSCFRFFSLRICVAASSAQLLLRRISLLSRAHVFNRVFVDVTITCSSFRTEAHRRFYCLDGGSTDGVDRFDRAESATRLHTLHTDGL